MLGLWFQVTWITWFILWYISCYCSSHVQHNDACTYVHTHKVLIKWAYHIPTATCMCTQLKSSLTNHCFIHVWICVHFLGNPVLSHRLYCQPQEQMFPLYNKPLCNFYATMEFISELRIDLTFTISTNLVNLVKFCS